MKKLLCHTIFIINAILQVIVIRYNILVFFENENLITNLFNLKIFLFTIFIFMYFMYFLLSVLYEKAYFAITLDEEENLHETLLYYIKTSFIFFIALDIFYLIFLKLDVQLYKQLLYGYSYDGKGAIIPIFPLIISFIQALFVHYLYYRKKEFSENKTKSFFIFVIIFSIVHLPGVLKII